MTTEADAPPVDGSTPPAERERKRDIVARYAKRGLTLGAEGLQAGEAKLKKAVGLGAVPNAVPVETPLTNIAHREVHVGWHPVGGLAGKWFATQTGLGKLITEKINSYPDPTQHWAVLIGDYAHQLWMDENFDVIYTNQKIVREEWTTFAVGTTRFNDDAVRRTGEMVIAQIREVQPGYNLITNNCQTYALRLLDAIKSTGAVEFPTTLAVYERLTGPGTVMDLFKPSEEQAADASAEPANAHAVSNAASVMNNNTNQIDANKKQEEKDSDDDDDEEDPEVGRIEGTQDRSIDANGADDKKKKGGKVIGALKGLFTKKKNKSESPEPTQG